MSTTGQAPTARRATRPQPSKGAAREPAPGRGSESGRSAKWHKRRQEIVDTSATVFARQGYHGTGTAELCEANNLAKGAFYYYIGSKEELLEAINDRIMDEMMLGVERVARVGGSASEQLAMLGAEFLEVMVRFPDHLWVLIRDYPALTGDYAKRFAKRRREYEQRIEDVIRAGIAAGEFRDVDVSHAAQAWIGSKTYMWRTSSGRQSATSFASTFEDIFVRGISTPD